MALSDRRRDAPRFPVRDSIVFGERRRLLGLGRTTERRWGPLINLSTRGLQFLRREPASPGSLLSLALDVPAYTDRIPLRVQVSWCRPLAGGVFRIGGALRGEAPPRLLQLLREESLRHRPRSPFLR